jgi:hypothetical protein
VLASNVPDDCTGTIADAGHDVRTGGCVGTHADPRLGPLDDNGGGILTRSLRAGSGALDIVPAGAACAATDARGVARPQGGACDAGAYERALPMATTGPATGITAAAATLSGGAGPNAGAASYHFEYGTSPGYGARTADSDAGGGIATVPASAAITGLSPSTTYHYRLVATNADGTSYGDDQSFTTSAAQGPVGGGDRTAPLLTRVSARPPRFRLGRRGTTLRYTVSEQARVVFTVSRKGRRIGRFAKPSAAGAGTTRFSGKIGKRSLKRGRYVVTLVATDAAGNVSAPRRLAITVLAP